MVKDHPFRLSLDLRPRRRMGGALFIVAALFTHALTGSPSAKAMQVAMNPSIAGKYSGDPSSDMAPNSSNDITIRSVGGGRYKIEVDGCGDSMKGVSTLTAGKLHVSERNEEGVCTLTLQGSAAPSSSMKRRPAASRMARYAPSGASSPG